MTAEATYGEEVRLLSASARPPRDRIRAALRRTWQRWWHARRQRRLERELSWLDAHLLRDMGFTDTAIAVAAAQREQRAFQDRLWLQAGGPIGRWGA